MSFSFGLLFILFLKAPPHPATISLSLAIHFRKAAPSPFRGPKHFLSLYEGLSGTFSTKQTAKVGIQRRVGRQYVLTLLEAFQRLRRFHSLALVMFRSMMAAITTCLLLPAHRGVGERCKFTTSTRKTISDLSRAPLKCLDALDVTGMRIICGRKGCRLDGACL